MYTKDCLLAEYFPYLMYAMTSVFTFSENIILAVIFLNRKEANENNTTDAILYFTFLGEANNGIISLLEFEGDY